MTIMRTKIPFSAYLMSDIFSLQDYEQGKIVSVEEVKRRLIESARLYNPYLPDYVYENDFNAEYEKEEQDSLAIFLYSELNKLANRYLFETKGSLYIKKEYLEEWMEITRIFSPLLIDAAYFSKQFLYEKNKDRFFFQVLVPNFQTGAQKRPYIFELDNLVREGCLLEDLHIHLNGSTEPDIIWWSQIGRVDKWLKTMKPAFYDKGNVRNQYEQLYIPDYTTLAGRLRKAKSIIIQLSDTLFNNDIIFKYPSQLYLPDSNPVLAKGGYFYLCILNELRKGNNNIARKFHYLILIIGNIHRLLVMQRNQKGFTQFEVIPQNDIRYLYEANNYAQRFDQLIHDRNFYYLDYLEGRFSPYESTKENRCLISKIYKQFSERINAKRNYMPRLGLVAHFIKKPDKFNNTDIELERHHVLRNEIFNKGIALISTEESLTCTHIVGIDAASDEMNAGPEVFAPIFRFLRRKWPNTLEFYFKNIDVKSKEIYVCARDFSPESKIFRERYSTPSKLHFTFHAGEDFVHILSGLRRMVEAVEFLNMEQGDRIGHGTAAGIDPVLWAKCINKEIHISKGEWLDDLIFVYSLIKEANHLYENLLIQLPAIMDEILELSMQVYGEASTINILERAWECRKYDPECCLMQHRKWLVNSCEKSCKKLLEDNNIKRIYAKYHYNTNCKNEYNKQISIKIDNGLFSSEDLRCIQNLVLDKLARKGIAIEVQFTSNLYISFYRNADEHHLERWIKGRSEKGLLIPPIVIGSDDPGIFMTNIYIEYARIMEYLERKGYSMVERINVIKNINEMSHLYRF